MPLGNTSCSSVDPFGWMFFHTGCITNMHSTQNRRGKCCPTPSGDHIWFPEHSHFIAAFMDDMMTDGMIIIIIFSYFLKRLSNSCRSCATAETFLERRYIFYFLLTRKKNPTVKNSDERSALWIIFSKQMKEMWQPNKNLFWQHLTTGSAPLDITTRDTMWPLTGPRLPLKQLPFTSPEVHTSQKA